MEGENTAIVPGVGDDQDHDPSVAIPTLQFQLALEGLDVTDPHLGLEIDSLTLEEGAGIPGTAVARLR